jgi:response regulator of citrate/malate metabolism
MNILIIEDDVLLAEKIKNIFQSKVITNRVHLAYSLKDFTHQLAILSSFDIVLTDIKLSNYTNHSKKKSKDSQYCYKWKWKY